MTVHIQPRRNTRGKETTGIVIIKWECPNCGQRLGDVLGDRVVIKVSGRSISVPLRDGVDQSCPRCGAYSEIRLIQ